MRWLGHEPRPTESEPTYGVALDLERTQTKDLIMKRPGSRRGLITGMLGTAGLCLALIAAGTPAQAAPSTQPSAASVGGAPSAFAPTLVAGYLATPGGGLATASLRFKVPKVKCTAGETRALSIGLGDIQDLEAPKVRAHVTLTCPDGAQAEYTFAAQACSHAAGPLATKHGHKVTVALAQSGGTITMTVTDEDEGTTLSATDSSANCGAPGTVDSVLFGAFPVFAPTLVDVPEFKKIKSRDATLNDADLAGVKVDRQTDPGVKTSKLKTELSASPSTGLLKKSGDAFSLRYRDVVHCCMEPSSPAGAPRRVV